jgi:hypothetical protein
MGRRTRKRCPIGSRRINGVCRISGTRKKTPFGAIGVHHAKKVGYNRHLDFREVFVYLKRKQPNRTTAITFAEFYDALNSIWSSRFNRLIVKGQAEKHLYSNSAPSVKLQRRIKYKGVAKYLDSILTRVSREEGGAKMRVTNKFEFCAFMYGMMY